MDWAEYFKMMIDWKKLPAYKAEPRIDSLIGFFMKHILEDFFNEHFSEIIPELPIRLGTVRPELNKKAYAERSYKVDFFAIGNKGVNYLIEFKTDTKSRRTKQDEYLKAAKTLGTKDLIDGILRISDVSSYKKKYNHLKNKLNKVGLLDENFEYSNKNNRLEIVYVQPSNHDNENLVIDFNWIANWLESYNKAGIFEKEFADALRTWSYD